jgi:hypothetical protein
MLNGGMRAVISFCEGLCLGSYSEGSNHVTSGEEEVCSVMG